MPVRYIWQARGMSLSARVRYLEERWAYFLLFGMPSTALCLLGNSLANAALFGLTFPAVRWFQATLFVPLIEHRSTL